MFVLPRAAIARVLESLLRGEMKAASYAHAAPLVAELPRGPWSEDMRLGQRGEGTLGCDSLDLLRLAAATNEMFHLHEAGQEHGLLLHDTFGAWVSAIEAAWQAGVQRITFSTSGSTGKAKRSTHTFANLTTEVEFLTTLFPDTKRVVTFTPAHHIYGFLFTALLPANLGIETVSEAESPGSQGRLRSGDLIVTFPERLQWLERTVTGWPANVQIVVSTAPCPRPLLQSLHEAGLNSITEVYGSTETAGVGWRRWPEREFRLMPQWQVEAGSAPAGTTLRHTSGVTADLMDHLAWSGPSHFAVLGRLDGAVQVGGQNVFPERIAAFLRTHPAVSDAAVRLMRPEEGQRLKAFIVVHDGTSADDVVHELEAMCLQKLAAAERPKAMAFGKVLPRNDFGKLQDW